VLGPDLLLLKGGLLLLLLLLLLLEGDRRRHEGGDPGDGADLAQESCGEQLAEVAMSALGEGKPSPNDTPLFGWVVQHYSQDWLICDDGPGEVADFVHIGEDDTLSFIHVKKAEIQVNRTVSPSARSKPSPARLSRTAACSSSRSCSRPLSSCTTARSGPLGHTASRYPAAQIS
jgi:hypothetical protein